MLDAADGRGTSTAVVAADLDHIRVGLGHTRRDNTNAGLCHELDRHLCGFENLSLNGGEWRWGAAAGPSVSVTELLAMHTQETTREQQPNPNLRLTETPLQAIPRLSRG